MIRRKFNGKNSGIYQIVNNYNNKRYIGSALEISKRWNYHLCLLRDKRHYNRYLQNAWNKYGESSFDFEVLLYCRSDELIINEQKMIDLYSSANGSKGYNLSPTAGNNLGVKFTKETKSKISSSQRGKIIPEEVRDKISKSLKGNIPWNKGKKGTVVPWNKGLKGVTVPWNKGKKTPKCVIKKLSEAHKGYVMPEGQKKKISESLKKHLEKREHWNVGYRHTEEAKRRIAEFQKGRVRSEETKRKISETKRQVA